MCREMGAKHAICCWPSNCNSRGHANEDSRRNVLNTEKSLCANCRFATIVRGRTLDEEIVHCGSITTRGMRVTFKVTSCTSHSDIDQPS